MKSIGSTSSVKKPLHTWTLGDVLAALLITGFGVYFLLIQNADNQSATEVLISKGGQPLSTFSLDVNRQVDLKQFGINMVVEIKDGQVRVASSDCKQQLCVRHGWIKQPGETVFCLPNHITVELSGEGPQYDAISR